MQIQGVAGAGGILLDPGGQIEQTFAWGIGHRTNNEAEWLALLQGMEILANTGSLQDSDIWRFKTCYI